MTAADPMRRVGRMRPGVVAVAVAVVACGCASVLLGSWLGGRGAEAAGVPGSGWVGFAVAAVRLVGDGAGALVVGASMLPLLLMTGRHGTPGRRAGLDGPSERAHRAARLGAGRLAVSAAGSWAIASVVALWLQAADAVAGTPFEVRPSALVHYATEVAAGRGLLLTVTCALLVMAVQATASRAVTGAHGRRYPELALGAAVLGVLPSAVTGHAGGHASEDPAVLVITLHVVAACGWVGGLFAVAIVLRRRPMVFGLVLPRFSTAAGYCAVLVLVSGVLSAMFRLPSPAALVNTGYGVLILMKSAGLSALLALGWRARRGLLPRAATLAAGPASSTVAVPVTRWLGAEMVLMSTVLGLAAALAGSAP